MRPPEKPAKGAKPSLGETGITPRELAAVKAARGAAAAANLGAPVQDPNRRRGFGKLK